MYYTSLDPTNIHTTYRGSYINHLDSHGERGFVIKTYLGSKTVHEGGGGQKSPKIVHMVCVQPLA